MGRIPNPDARDNRGAQILSVTVTELDYIGTPTAAPAADPTVAQDDAPAAGSGKRARKRAAPEPAQPVGELEAVAPAAPADSGEHQQSVAPADRVSELSDDELAELAELNRRYQAEADARAEAELENAGAVLPPSDATGGRAKRQRRQTKREQQAEADAQRPMRKLLPDEQAALAALAQRVGKDDLGDAEALADILRGRLLYDVQIEDWFEYGAGPVPHLWYRQYGKPLVTAMRALSEYYFGGAAVAAGAGDRELSKKLSKRGQDVLSTSHIERTLKVAASHNELLAGVDVPWDANPMLLSVRNGVIELDTGTFRPGRPSDMLTIAAPTEWGGLNVPAPRWEQFLLEVLEDAELVQFLRRLLGYAVSGEVREHILILLIGIRGRNGKTLMFETLSHVLGKYAHSIDKDAVIAPPDGRGNSGNATPHLMQLRGRRMVYTSETSDGAALNAAQVKYATGGDSITARPLYGQLVTFRPTHTIFLATNSAPQSTYHDDALHERLIVLNYRLRFVDYPQTPDERPVDKELIDALIAEAGGILAWLVRGHLEYRRVGLNAPESVKLAKRAYRNRQSIDGWIDECVELDNSPDARTRSGALFESYCAWCERQGMTPQTNQWFGRQLRNLAAKGVEAQKIHGLVWYEGIRLRSTTPTGPQTATNASAADVGQTALAGAVAGAVALEERQNRRPAVVLSLQATIDDWRRAYSIVASDSADWIEMRGDTRIMHIELRGIPCTLVRMQTAKGYRFRVESKSNATGRHGIESLVEESTAPAALSSAYDKLKQMQ